MLKVIAEEVAKTLVRSLDEFVKIDLHLSVFYRSFAEIAMANCFWQWYRKIQITSCKIILCNVSDMCVDKIGKTAFFQHKFLSFN